MEVNQISNFELIRDVSNKALNYLISQNKINPNNLPKIKSEFGYMFTREDGYLEALFKLIVNNEMNFYMALQENKLLLLNMDEQRFRDTVNNMKQMHECLRKVEWKETDTQKNRRQKNNEYLKNHNITYKDSLACIHDENNVTMKNIDEVCKRAITSLLVIQIACDIRNGSYEQSKEFFLPILKKFGVLDYLNSKEKRIMDGTYSEQDVIDMDWEYEAYWSICWCLGLVNDISDASTTCDCDIAISFVMKSQSIDDFKSKCHLRNISEILDMEDLYYRYSWAINEKKINPAATIGKLDTSNVLERRRGLEWIISKENDWYNIDLSA